MASWAEKRGQLIMMVESMAGDFRDRDLRERLTEICDMLWLSDGPEKYTHQMEARTRTSPRGTHATALPPSVEGTVYQGVPRATRKRWNWYVLSWTSWRPTHAPRLDN
jgi:hypothetical protein